MAPGTERVRGAYRVVKTLYSPRHARVIRLRPACIQQKTHAVLRAAAYWLSYFQFVLLCGAGADSGNVICTQGQSLIIVVLFSRYTEIETLFSFISIIKKIIVCDRRYFEKPIDIVCWACMSSIQCGKVLCWPWSMIAYLTIQRFKDQIEKLCFSSTFSRRGNLVYGPIAL